MSAQRPTAAPPIWKLTLQTAWSNLDESAVRRSCLSAVLRFEAVVKAKGGHIEWCYCRLDIHMFTNICTKNQLNIFANNRNIWKNRSVNLSAPPCIFILRSDEDDA